MSADIMYSALLALFIFLQQVREYYTISLMQQHFNYIFQLLIELYLLLLLQLCTSASDAKIKKMSGKAFLRQLFAYKEHFQRKSFFLLLLLFLRGQMQVQEECVDAH